MAEIHYNLCSKESGSRLQRSTLNRQNEVIYKIITEDVMFNNEEHQLLYNIHHMTRATRPHMFYKGGSQPHEYNDRSSIARKRVTKHGTILRNLGYIGCKPKVFIKIHRNQYESYHVNRLVEVKHERIPLEYQLKGYTDNQCRGIHQDVKWILRY